jgi:hypothetical protein
VCPQLPSFCMPSSSDECVMHQLSWWWASSTLVLTFFSEVCGFRV